MAHTNKKTVRHKNRYYNLNEMTGAELNDLRESLRLARADISGQLYLADERNKAGKKIDTKWYRKAVSVSKIKTEDIAKIDKILEELGSVPAPKARDVNLQVVLIEAMEDLIPDEVIQVILDRVYTAIYGEE